MRTTFPRLERARTLVAEELTRTRAERTAFRQFLRRISRFEEPTGQPSPEQEPGRHPVTGQDELRVERIESIYRDTVMSTAHYDEEYGESFRANVNGELGPEFASVLADGRGIGAFQYRMLCERTRNAIEERDTFADIVQREHESLRSVDDRLSEIETGLYEVGGISMDPGSFGTGSPEYERLLELEDACEHLADRRQETLHTRVTAQLSGVDVTNLVAYLYGECEFTCPALAEIVDVLEDVRRCRHRCECRGGESEVEGGGTF